MNERPSPTNEPSEREELGGFVPAAIAIALLVMILTFILSGGSVFQGLQNIDKRNSALEALATAHRAPKELKDFLEISPSGDLNVVENPQNSLYNYSLYIKANINSKDVEVYTAIYQVDDSTPDKLNLLTTIVNCVNSKNVPSETICPATRELTTPNKSELNKYQILSFVVEESGDIIAFENYPVDQVPAREYDPGRTYPVAIPTSAAAPVCE